MTKRTTNNIIAILTALVIALSGIGFNVGITNAKTTRAQTPVGVNNAHLKWEKQFGTGYDNAVSPPTLYDGYLYVTANTKIYKVDSDSGEVKKEGNIERASKYTTIAPTCANGKVFVGIEHGQIEALDASTLEKLWTSDDLGEDSQTISPITYVKGYILTGLWGGSSSYICLDEDGNTIWRAPSEGGYYWAGAYTDGTYAVYGSDAGKVRSVEISTGVEKSSIAAEGEIRGSVVYRDGYIYFVTKAKKLYKAKYEDGIIGDAKSIAISGESTGVPAINEDGNRIYVGTSAAKVDVVDLNAADDPSGMKLIYSVKVPGYPQGEMLIRKNDDTTDYIYLSYNKEPGGLSFIEAGAGNAIENGLLYTTTHSQYGISPVVCDDSGTLFFKNDSGYLMAVAAEYDLERPTLKKGALSAAMTSLSWTYNNGSTYEIWRATSQGGPYSKIGTTNNTKYSDAKALPNTTYYYKVRGNVEGRYTEYSNIVSAKATLAKPKVTTKAGKKKVTVKWKKITGASGYKVYRATKKKGKYKLVKTIKKDSTVKFVNKKLKKKKKYYYKVRAYKTVSGKTAYSAWSNISYKKAK